MITHIIRVLRYKGAAVLATAIYRGLKILWFRYVLKRHHIACQVHDYHMLLDVTDQGLSRTLLLFGTRELDHKIILERVLKPGMAVLDIGANLGYYALMEHRLIGPLGRLVAIEPSPSNQEILKMNLDLN
ncbi:MAG: hypothetical protein HQL60_08135, partial [Magnetococcales bacterium]|nr:hypothetical protein [Magnetococcales bacterium]